MNFQIMEQAAKLLSMKKKHNIYILSVSCAAVLTAFGVVFALTRPGQAFSSLEKTLDCHVEVHQHTADCYDADGNLICGYADYVAHVHDPELCYDDNGELVCTLPEIIPHEHDDSCYIERLELICGLEEGQVVDENGVGVFDEAGNPVFDIEAVPSLDSISVEGDVEETEATSIEETVTEEIISEDIPSDLEGTTPTDTTASPEAVVSTPNETDEGTEGASAPANNTDAPAESETPVDNGETAAEAEAEAPEGTVSTETVDLGGANAGLAASSRYTHHVHTAECYEVVKELVCTIPALHVHTAECFDENGNCICGQLQLVQHVHGEDCFVFEEKTITKTAVAGDYTVTATYGASAKIPSKAEFRARIIEPGTEEYEEAAAKMLASTDEQIEFQVLLDIGFFVNDEEIEPAGPVDIKIDFDNVDVPGRDSYTFFHIKGNGDVDVETTVIDENQDLNVTMDSFSPVALGYTINGWGINIGTDYGTYHTNATVKNDAFRTEPEFAAYRNYDYDIGLANNFHIVAFNNYTGQHFFGSMAVKNLKEMHGNIGAEGYYGLEVSYFQNVEDLKSIEVLNFNPNSPDSIVAFGTTNSSNEMSYVVDSYDNGNGIQFKTTDRTFEKQLLSPHRVYFDVNGGQFINFITLENEVREKSAYLARFKQINTKAYDLDADGKEHVIEILDDDSACYISFTGTEFNNAYGKQNDLLYLKGFNFDKKGTLIINIDCENLKDPVNKTGELKLPLEVHIYGPDGETGTGEKIPVKQGKVIFNIINSDGITINFRGVTQGLFIAPGATVNVGSTFSGQIFGRDVNIGAETHWMPFTGTIEPAKVSFDFFKKVGGEEPKATQKFQFNLYEYDYVNHKWPDADKPLDVAYNEGTNVTFKNLKYDPNDTTAVGTHWYYVAEVKGSGDTATASYEYDFHRYIMKVVVVKDAQGNLKSSQVTYLVDSENDIVKDENGDIVNVNEKAKKVINGSGTFDNTPNFTDITVIKVWKDLDGETDLVDDIPSELKVYLVRTTNKDAKLDTIDVKALDNITLEKDKVYEINADVSLVDKAVLTKETGWKKEWTELASKDSKGATYYYYVLEEGILEFEPSTDQKTWYLKGTQQYTNKKKPELTYLIVDKQFFGYDLNNEAAILDKDSVTTDDNASITARLYQIVKDADGNVISRTLYTNFEIVGRQTPVVNGEFTITKADGWTCTIEGLPKTGFDADGKVINYDYQVEETNCTLPYIYLKDSDNDEYSDAVIQYVDGKEDGRTCVIRNIIKPSELEIDKSWFTYSGTQITPSDIKIELKLVRRTSATATPIDVATFKLGYNGAEAVTGSGIGFERAKDVDNSDKPWAAKITGLPAYYVDVTTKQLVPYTYEVIESPIEGYELVTLAVGDPSNPGNIIIDQSVTTAVLVQEADGTSVIKLINRLNSSFELPETGGTGVIPFYVVGGLSIFASLALLVYRRKLRKN